MLRGFRSQGAKARDVIIGSPRKPEAVVMSYERYLDLIDRLADHEMREIATTRLSAPGTSAVVDLDAVAATLGVDATTL